MNGRADTGESGGRKSRGTILIADTPEGIATLKRTLGGDDVAYVTASTLPDARDGLRSGLDLILCGIHFDRGRMFDFLRLAKSTPETAHVPFVCVRATGMIAKALVPHSIETASRQLGAVAYIDHIHLENTRGTAEADRLLRKSLIDACRT